MYYTITVSNSGTTVMNASFNDNFPAGITNVVLESCNAFGGAVCPLNSNYTISNSSFFWYNSFFTSWCSVVFVISLIAPTTTNGVSSISNTATVTMPVGITELDSTTNTSTWNTTLFTEIDLGTDISLNASSLLGDCSSFPLDVEYSILWYNNSALADSNTNIMNTLVLENIAAIGIGNANINFSFQLSNVNWSSNNNINLNSVFNNNTGTINLNSGNNNITLASLNQTVIALFAPGDSIYLNYTLTLDSPVIIDGCDEYFTYELANNSSTSLGNQDLVDINNSNNLGSLILQNGICDIAPNCPSIDIGTTIDLDTTLLGDCITYPLSIDYTVKWFNNGLVNDSNTILSNALSFTNISTSGLGNMTYDFPFSVTNTNWTTTNTSLNLPPINFIDTLGVFNMPSPAFITSLENVEIPFFLVGDTITLTYTFTIDSPIVDGCDKAIAYDLLNVSSFSIGIENLIDSFQINNTYFNINNNGICDLSTPCDELDLSTIVTSFSDTNLQTCQYPIITDYVIQWTNNGPSVAYNVEIENFLQFANVSNLGGNIQLDIPYQIINLNWQTNNPNIAIPTSTFLDLIDTLTLPNSNSITALESTIMDSLNQGDTITLTYTIEIEEPSVLGCGGLSFSLASGAIINYDLSVVDTNTVNNFDFGISESIDITSIDLAISESVNPSIVNHLDTTEITIIFQNASGLNTDDASWSQILPSNFEIIQNSIMCVTINGAVNCTPVFYDSITNTLSQFFSNMPANSSVEITFLGVVNSIVSTSINLEAFAETPCLDCIPITNFTQTTFQINGLCDLAYAGEIVTDASNCDLAQNGSIILLTTGAINGTLNYLWEDSSGNVLSQNSDTLTNLAPGEYTVTISDDGVLGCEIQTTIIVSCLNLYPPIVVNDDTSTFEDVSVSINIITNDSDTDGIIINSTIDLDVNTPGIQDSIFTNEGFWYVDTFGIVYFTPLENFNGLASLNYTVFDNDNLISNQATITILVIPENDNPVAVDDYIDVFNTDSISISVLFNDFDSIDLLDNLDNSSLVIIENPSNGVVTIDTVNGAITYTPNPGFEGVDSFMYLICDDGNPELCDSAWVFINVIDPYSEIEGGLLIPNAFTPNNDGLNDVFRPYRQENLKNLKFRIYNRWGDLIFNEENSSELTGWDGTHLGVEQVIENYIWYLNYFYNDVEYKISGVVTLLR